MLPVLTAVTLMALPSGDGFTLKDIQGQAHHPWRAGSTKAAVLIFISTDCPVANYYHPTVRRLVRRFGPKGVKFFYVHPDPDVTAAKARRHAKEYRLAAPVILDGGRALTRAVGAKVTPEAFVVNRRGETLYRGRIDDTYVTWGRKRRHVRSEDLADAIESVLAGKPVKVPATEPVGCFISEVKPSK